jgi:hypothetical protein
MSDDNQQPVYSFADVVKRPCAPADADPEKVIHLGVNQGDAAPPTHVVDGQVILDIPISARCGYMCAKIIPDISEMAVCNKCYNISLKQFHFSLPGFYQAVRALIDECRVTQDESYTIVTYVYGPIENALTDYYQKKAASNINRDGSDTDR